MVRPRHAAEYAALRLALPFISALPAGAVDAIAVALAAAMWAAGWRRAETIRRIRSVPGLAVDDLEATRIGRRALVNFLRGLLDAARAPRLSASWVRRHVRIDGEGHLRAAVQGGRGAIIALAHLGSWEMAGLVGPLLRLPLVALAAEQRNPLASRFLMEWRRRNGTEVIARSPTALVRMVRRLKAGALVAIPIDLRAPTPALRVRFLGGEANLGRGLCAAARLAQVVVVPCAIFRESPRQHVFRLYPPLSPPPRESMDPDAVNRALLQAVVDALEPEIRRHPDQYFWFNRRWVLDPLPG